MLQVSPPEYKPEPEPEPEPGDIPEQCPEPIAQLTRVFDGISEQINDLGKEFDVMRVAVTAEL